MDLAPHHVASIENLVRALEPDPTVRALVLGGSLAHGFARPDSDVDVTIVVGSEELERRTRSGELTWATGEHVTYEGGYVDAKFVDLPFLRDVAARGSDQARYAYDGARILFSREPDLAEVLDAVVRYPIEEQAERTARFAAQLLGWRWYHRESLRLENTYLELLGRQKLVLFTCRLVLAQNAMLFPFHKWMLRVTECAPHRPADLMETVDTLLAGPSPDMVEQHCRDLLAFYGVDHAEVDRTWPGRFLHDVELAWRTGHPPVDEL